MHRVFCVGVVAVLVGACVWPSQVHGQQVAISGKLLVAVHDSSARMGGAWEEMVIVREDGSSYQLEVGALSGPDRLRLRSASGGTAVVRGRQSRALSAPAASQPMFLVSSVDQTEAKSATSSLIAGPTAYAMVMCRFSDMSDVTPKTREQAEYALTGGADPFFQEISSGRASLSGSRVFGWFNLARAYAYYYGADFTTRFRSSLERDLGLQKDCLDAAGSAVNVATYDGILIQHNAVTSSSYAYLSPISITRDGQTKAFRMAWYQSGHAAHPGVIAHEIGHTFGAEHSSASYFDFMSCGGCAVYDPVAGQYIGPHTIGYSKTVFGWLDARQRVRVDTASVLEYLLDPLASPPSAATQLLEIPIPNKPGQLYTVEYRLNMGKFEFLRNQGVLIYRINATSVRDWPGGVATAMDGTDFIYKSDVDYAWTPGRVFTDSANGISVAVESLLGGQVKIRVMPGYQLGLRAAGNGSGRIASNPGVTSVVNCSAQAGVTSGACVRYYHSAEVLVLSATADANSRHVGWEGACSGGAGSLCILPMTSARNVSAVFALKTAAVALALRVQATSSTSGMKLSPAPVVELRDDAGQPLLRAGVSVTARVTSGGGALSGVTTVNTDASGLATFANLTIIGTGAQTLQFSASGLPSVASLPVVVSALPATALAVAVQPSEIMSGATFRVPPTVELRDSLNRAVLQDGVVITAAIGAGSGSLSGIVSATTNALGRATFGDLRIAGQGVHTIRFSTAGIAPSTSVSFNVTTIACQWCNNPVAFTGNVLPTGWASNGYSYGFGVGRLVNNRIELNAGQGIILSASGAPPIGSNSVDFSFDLSTPDVWVNAWLRLGKGAKGVFIGPNATGDTLRAVWAKTDSLSPEQGSVGPGAYAFLSSYLQARITPGSSVRVRAVFIDGWFEVTVSRPSDGVVLGRHLIPLEGFRVADVSGVQLHPYGGYPSPLKDGWIDNVDVRATTKVLSALGVVQQPTTGVSGAKLSNIVVEVRDSTGQASPERDIQVVATRSSGTGVLSGTLTATTDTRGQAVFSNLTLSGIGDNRLTFTATGRVEAASGNIRVGGSLAVQPFPSAVLTQGTPYSASLVATGGTGTYQWSVVGGALPRGLTLSASGRISGTPAEVDSGAVAVQVASGAERQFLTFMLNVNAWATLRVVVSGRGSVLSSGDRRTICAMPSDTTRTCDVALSGVTGFVAVRDSAFGFAGWTGACNGRTTCLLTTPPSSELRATFLRAPDVSADTVALDLLRGTFLTPDQRSILDRIGNGDGVFNLGDLLAHIDRTQQVLSARVAAELSAASPAVARPFQNPPGNQLRH